MPRQEIILAFLQAQNIPYTLVQHPPAYNMQDIAAFGVTAHGHVCKNLFLRDSKKGKHHFLVTARGDLPVDLDTLGEKLGWRLSFASEERLLRHLQLTPGQVSPLAAYFNQDNAVQVVLDAGLAALGTVGVHPCDNAATVFLSFDDLVRAVKACGNPVSVMELA
ncbi:prolyl-tRNA synthetase associated domain-containing protein [Ruminococcaceae bacterium OttesenSCG-928-O06]|nr:prolyl-tRNA synthetase associated domain-containing protein [Ruminococcaceae bacterium OttesenSCG-928-O06]